MLKTLEGKPIFDAKKPITLVITRGDCSKADPKEPSSCAAAIALRRQFSVQEVRVHLTRTYVRYGKGEWTRYNTPLPLRTEIIAFDRGGKFSPGEFVLSVVPPSRKRTGRTQGSLKNGSHRKKETRPRHVAKNVRHGPA